MAEQQFGRRVRKRQARRERLGLESLVDVGAHVQLAIVVLTAAFYWLSTPRLWLTPLFWLVGAASVWLVMRALAEIIRLLKRQVGLDYTGTISEGSEREVEVFACSECGVMLHARDRCDACGVTIIEDD